MGENNASQVTNPNQFEEAPDFRQLSFEELEEVFDRAGVVLPEQIETPPELNKLIEDNFWDLLDFARK